MNRYERMIDRAKGARHVARTPRGITPEILAFCARLDAGAYPAYLPVTPAPFAQVAKCYLNVIEACELVGGTPHLGWLIWEMPGVYLTAEHHAVVEREGHLFDVTPTLFGEARVLFLPIADALPEEPTFTLNRYMPLVDHELVLRAVELMELNQSLCATGDFDSAQFRRNDEEGARKLDDYFHLLRVRQERAVKKIERARKKAARKRR